MSKPVLSPCKKEANPWTRMKRSHTGMSGCHIQEICVPNTVIWLLGNH